MSTESIVNRVSQNFVQDELAKLEPPTVDEQPVYDVLTGQTKSREEFDKGPAYSPAKPDAAELAVDLEGSANTLNTNPNRKKGFNVVPPTPEPVEDQADNIGNTTGQIASVQFNNEGSLISLASLVVSRPEFDKFRAQVIMALKHQGIDVRKYFPE